MNLLDNISEVPKEQISLDSLVPSTATEVAPHAAIRNRAATAVVLSSEPATLVADYQSLVAQEEEGSTNATQLKLDMFFKEDNQRDMKAIMSVLSNPNLTVEQKRGAVEAMNKNPILKDSGQALLTRGLEMESEGETLEAEDARISTSDMVREIYETREQVQNLVNAHGASLSDSMVEASGGLLEMALAPFATNVSAYKLKKDAMAAQGKTMSIWDHIKAFALAGTSIMDVREGLSKLPPEAQVEYTQNLLKIIKENSNVIFGSDNQYNQFLRAQSVFEEGGYSGVDKFIDNASVLLDVIGVGQVLKSASRLKRVARGAEITPSAEPTFPPRGISGFEETKLPPPMIGGQNEEKIAGLQSKVDSLKAEGGNAKRISQLEKAITNLEKLNKPTPAKLNPIMDAIRRVELNAIVRQENPSSVAGIAQQANPNQARSIFEAVFKSTDDAVAEGLYGVGKQQAIVNDVFPQITTSGGRVLSKPVDIQRKLRLDPKLSAEMKYLLGTSDVAIHYSKEALANARSNIVKDFSSSTDLVPNDAMGTFESGFKADGSFVNIGAVYGTKEGAFIDATEAFNQAKFALRNEGILENEIEILSKQGLDYAPVSLDSVRGKPGSYLVRINTRREIDPTDITKWEADETVRFNFFDRVKSTVWNRTGSVSRWMFDAASMLPKRLTGSAVVATDMSSRFERAMLDIATRFSDGYNPLPAARKSKIDAYIKEANFKGLPYDRAKLIADGFSDMEQDVLRSWRDFWDAHYVLENHDVIRTLNSHGYQLFKNAQTELYARPISKNTQLGKIYDPSTGMVINISSLAIDELYTKGGTIARLRRPTEFSFGMPSGAGSKNVTDTTEYMIVRNTPNEYLRRFRDTDEVLNYREGYYQIQYNAPRFVDEITYGSDGRETGRKAVAVAGDTAEAQHFADRQARGNPDKKYEVRSDDKASPIGSDDWFDLNSVRGRVAQKHRGKLLEDATGLNHLGDGSYIVNPVESAIRASRSIAGRTVSRPMLEAAKARYVAQFGQYLPPNEIGGRKFPSTVDEIGRKGQFATSEVADARTTWEYINYLENGYINSIDEFVKGGLNSLATMLGELGMTKAERAALFASERTGPTGFAKNFVFHAYIGTNILRNWIIQTNQIVRTMAYNPKGWLSGSMPKLLGEYSGIKLGTLKNPSAEGLAFTRFIDESGLLQSVDKQNLVRGSLLDAAGSSSRAVRVLGKAIELPRKVGFDFGESMNLLGHGAAVFDKWRRDGKDLTDLVTMKEAHSELRAISYDMNFAGDMVYNQTSAAALLQFMQVPHKAFLQATNRRIPGSIRARMLLADIVMWGPPTALISTMMGGDILPENKEAQEWFTHGAQGMSLNIMWSEFLGEDVNVDYSSLAPYDMDGWGKFFHAMMTGGVSQLINNSPAGQMFLADGGRIQSAIAQMSRFFSPWTPGERTPEEAVAVANEVAKIASGWSNAMKARQMFELKKLLDKHGNVIDPSVNSLEATMQLFGFTTGTARDFYNTQRLVAEGSKEYSDEVKQVYKEIKQYYQNAFSQGITDLKQQQAITGQLLQAYKDSPVALGIIQKELEKDLSGKDNQLMFMMLKSTDLPEFGLTVDQIRRAPISDEQKELYIQRLKDLRNTRSRINKEE